ncbi:MULTISPECIES: nicotinate-nucleotide adenylyltransferase [unclassified Sphingobium]|uniref:nicotinate-nucleotide adenylyltransferase n=1 Tax=unclassified Sphingobium TaxID=2611147 RepID=UPI002224838B|nr:MULTISPECIES: nicotinate-nucleotide adenylyltransferase [unclassified Sphingobium]MCW2381027.1 nicotinate-nucleotide adenylyltransferase [Sphingobium sp. B2D3B]MCW2398866.1 nicotinate-nucleotide adenylyltransferase [Sphingobium sp. B2D3C]
MTRGKRVPVGLLGGSFNPAHGGHRAISFFAHKALGLDEVWWLVSPGNPLKPRAGMAPLNARVASGKAAARRARIRVTAIEREMHTRYTLDTLRRLTRRYPHRRFIWLMGEDNLAQFHQWKGWRDIARTTAIAVIARPGYSRAAVGSPAMAWLRRFVRPASQSKSWTTWRLPALVLLRFRPDPRSATLLRQKAPLWHRSFADVAPIDGVTGRRIPQE